MVRSAASLVDSRKIAAGALARRARQAWRTQQRRPPVVVNAHLVATQARPRPLTSVCQRTRDVSYIASCRRPMLGTLTCCHIHFITAQTLTQRSK